MSCSQIPSFNQVETKPAHNPLTPLRDYDTLAETHPERWRDRPEETSATPKRVPIPAEFDEVFWKMRQAFYQPLPPSRGFFIQ
jgi:hypothetical protein